MTNTWIIVLIVIHLLVCLILYVLYKLDIIHTRAQLFPFAVCLPVCGPLMILMEERYERKHQMGIDKIGVEKLKIEDEIYKRIDVDASKDSSLTVPLEEALVIDDTATRRKLMMDILNRDPKQYVKLLQKIRMSSDTEVTHYATTSMAEIQRNHELEIRKDEDALHEDPEDLRVLKHYNRDLEEYISSGFLTSSTADLFRHKRQNVLRKIIKMRPEQEKYTLQYIRNEIDLGEYDALSQAVESIEKGPLNEEKCRLIEEYCRATHQGERLQKMLQRVKEENVYLSHKGREWYAFWTQEDMI